MNDIIVSTWGIGPTYRARIKDNILKAIGTGYDKILPYIILTDKPSDFLDLQKETGLIKAIINIHEEREKYSLWSKDKEYIPLLDGDDYGRDYREQNWKYSKFFSYGLHRFALPTISNLGYNKFLICDSDVDIRYDKIMSGETTEKEFWEQFNTPPNTLKGCDYEKVPLLENNKYNCRVIFLANIIRYSLGEKFPQYKPNLDCLKPETTQTEGPFRYYHLRNSEDVLNYFRLWDEGMRISLSNPQTKSHTNPGAYMSIDNTQFSVACEAMGVNIENFEKFWHTVNVYKKDRHFFPIGHVIDVDGEMLSLQPSDNLEEFEIINAKLIKHLGI
jgi:hypothetical protein